MHTDNDSISPIYRYKMLFIKRKPGEEIKEEDEISGIYSFYYDIINIYRW